MLFKTYLNAKAPFFPMYPDYFIGISILYRPAILFIATLFDQIYPILDISTATQVAVFASGTS
jgi:hypothetical protein